MHSKFVEFEETEKDSPTAKKLARKKRRSRSRSQSPRRDDRYNDYRDRKRPNKREIELNLTFNQKTKDMGFFSFIGFKEKANVLLSNRA